MLDQKRKTHTYTSSLLIGYIYSCKHRYTQVNKKVLNIKFDGEKEIRG